MAFCLIAIFADFIAPYDPLNWARRISSPARSICWGRTIWGRIFSARWFTVHACRCCSACFPHCWFR
ncbi:MAG: hypothetical protein ACLUMK_09160 [Christensenellales bacterium]